VYRLDGDRSYRPIDKFAAFQKAQEWGEKIPIGVFYREEKPTYESEFPWLEKGTLVSSPIEPIKAEKLLAEFF
jgi:2-oxoglutarate ferredoxin oxidoreductase subunit beta